jgi:hypothetical protein
VVPQHYLLAVLKCQYPGNLKVAPVTVNLIPSKVEIAAISA